MVEHFRRLFASSRTPVGELEKGKRIIAAEGALSNAIEQMGNANEKNPGELCLALQAVDEAVGKLAQVRAQRG